MDKKYMDKKYENMYDKMYSIIDIDYLQKFVEKIKNNKKAEISALFEIEEIINPTNKPNCISLCLFCRNVSNKEGSTENSLDYKCSESKWHDKYYKSLHRFIEDFNTSKYFSTFKIRLYLENQLSCFINELSSKSRNIEICLMKQNSIGAQPGMLWRFLSFDDKNLDVVYSSDIDIKFSEITNKLDAFINSKKAMGRYLSYCSDDFRINYNDENPLNYAVCLGSCIAMRPKLLDINIKTIIINYILYRHFRYRTSKPSEEFDHKDTSKYNRPVGDHIYGWGGYWTMYGFDEKVWKHTIFPYLVKKSQVLTWVTEENMRKFKNYDDTNSTLIDYKFTSFYNNAFVCI